MITCHPMGIKELAQFCHRVGTSLAAGVDIRKAMSREAEQGSIAMRSKLAGVRQHIATGGSLADAFAATGGTIPHLVCEMVALGEATGGLDTVFLRLADHYQGRLQIRRIFLAGITWPVLQLLLAIFVIGFLIWILGIIGNTDVLGFGLVGIPGLIKYCACIALMGTVLFLLIRGVLSGRLWSKPLQRWMMHTPVIGSSLKTIALSRIAWTMSLTFNSGMNARRAVQLAIDSAENALFSDHARQIERDIVDGQSVTDAFRASGAFPDEFLSMVAVGEESGRLAESMGRIANEYRDRETAALRFLAVVAGLIIWALVAAVIIFFIFRLAGFYFGMIRGAIQ
ncbi:MAG: type II secretion system F family protein [Pirellulales bacterium]|nr:type II secretion system F family protein [Pirellulales bacterium]